MIQSKKWFVLIFVTAIMTFVTFANSQESIKSIEEPDTLASFSYQISKVFPSLSHTKEELMGINTLSELNRFYISSWIKEYISVTVSSQINGKVLTAVGNDEMLTTDQKDIIKNADKGTEIYVIVNYYPNNNLSFIEEKVYGFTFVLDPEIDAQYKGGEDAINTYFKDKVIDVIPNGVYTGYRFSSIKFHIDKEGRVVDPHIFWSSEDEAVDKLMLDAVCNMPLWSPAKYEDGTPVKQEYSFNVGNMESCAINTLNLDKTSWAAEDK